MNAIFLCELNQRSLRKIRMELDLQGNWLDLAIGEKVHDSLAIEIGYAKMLYIAFGD